jgi:hypothetical protein
VAKRSAETMKAADDAIIRGTNNVFADLGFTDAEERQTKLRLAYAINGVIARKRLTQQAVGSPSRRCRRWLTTSSTASRWSG